jgi:hypothetical protein
MVVFAFGVSTLFAPVRSATQIKVVPQNRQADVPSSSAQPAEKRSNVEAE